MKVTPSLFDTAVFQVSSHFLNTARTVFYLQMHSEALKHLPTNQFPVRFQQDYSPRDPASSRNKQILLAAGEDIPTRVWQAALPYHHIL